MKKVFSFFLILIFVFEITSANFKKIVSAQTNKDSKSQKTIQNFQKNHYEINEKFTLEKGSANYVPGEILVKFKNNKINLEKPADRERSRQFAVAKNLDKKEDIRKSNISVLKIGGNESVENAVERLKNDPDVEYVQPNYIYYPSIINTNDPYKDKLWGLDNTADADIDAPEAWNISEGDKNKVIVAVIDTGVAYNHPDLAANMWDGNNCVDENGGTLGGCIHGYDFENEDKSPLDDLKHGTHVAGTIGALKNNGIGIIGVAPNVKIMAIKSGSEHFYTAHLIQGINFAQQNGARIINASWGGGSYDTALYNAIANFSGLFIAAAGNETNDNDYSHHYPSDYDLANIISVAATYKNDNLASFSNYGATSVDVGAPGADIYSTVPSLISSNILNENFDSITPPEIPNGWTKTGNWRTVDFGYDWGKLLSGDLNSPYSNNSNSTITLPTQNLNDTESASINFRAMCDTSYHLNSEGTIFQDYMALEISADGTNYFELKRWNEFSIDIKNGSGEDSTGSAITTYNLEIPANYFTDNFKLRFRWVSDDYDNNYAGCFVDDLKLTKESYTDGSDNKYGNKSGTSMAAPHVTGLAGLIWGYKPELSSAEVKNIILSTGDSILSLNGKTVSGKRINAYNALSSLVDNTPPFVVASFPIDNSTNISISAQPYLEFSEALNPSTIIAENVELRKYSDNTRVPAPLLKENNNKKIVFNLIGNLNYETQYYFFIGTGVKDIEGNSFLANTWYANQKENHEFTTEAKDITPPTIIEITPISTFTNNNTPAYTFHTTEAGKITYNGGCESDIVDAIAGNNTITFKKLADGIYDSCAITITDNAKNPSNPLLISKFTIDTIAPIFGDLIYTKINGENKNISPVNNGYSVTIDSSEILEFANNLNGIVYINVSGADLAGKFNVRWVEGNQVIGQMVYQTRANNEQIPVDGWYFVLAENIATPFTVGQNTFQVNFLDEADNETQAILHLTTTDAAAPVITLIGENPVTIEVGNVYTDAGATALDNIDGDITSNIITTGLPIDTSTLGAYIIHYNVSDSSGNKATEMTRTVNVVDTAAPVITLIGGDMNIYQGMPYTDAGATALDNVNGDITANIITNNPVDINVAGSYKITYNVSDSSGNQAQQVIRAVTVLSVEQGQSPIAENLNLDTTNTEILIGDNAPNSASITVPSSVSNARLNLGALLSGTDTKSANLKTNIIINAATNAGDVNVNIPAGQITSDSSWTGMVNMPQVKENSSVSVTPDSDNTASVSSVIEIGFDDVKLNFNKAVRIKINGQANKDAGYSRNGTFTKISNVCSADTQEVGDALSADGECKINVGSDLVIWTKHFTKFITYTQTKNQPASAPVSSGGGGGGGGGGYISITTYKPVAPSVIINNAENITFENKVSLKLSANYMNDNYSPLQMMISNNSNFDKAEWINFATSTVWTLNGANGVQTIYVKFKNRYGDSAVASDYIELVIKQNDKEITKKETLEKAKPIADTEEPALFHITQLDQPKILGAQIDMNLSKKLKGKFLLQIEQRGDIWYVDTTNYQRYKITLENALPLFKKLSLGITDEDLSKIPIAGSDQVGNAAIMNKLKGKFLLQVEQKGDIWHVDNDGYRYNITSGNLMELFRKLSLGISNENLYKIAENGLTSTSSELTSDKEPIAGKVLGEQIDKKLAKKLKGKLLLQVEKKGNIWYVDTIEQKRYNITLKNALPVFRKLSLGISNKDLANIPISENDQIGNTDLRNRVKGKLLLQTEQKGEIWYVDNGGYRYKITLGNLMELFRKLALGISDNDLSKIPEGNLSGF